MAEGSESRSVATLDLSESAPQPPQRGGDYTNVNIRHAETVNINLPEDHHLPSNSKHNELMLSIKESLKDRYRRKEACMRSLLWDDDGLDYPLERYCVDLQVEEKDLMGIFSEGNVISLDKIFFLEDKYGRRRKRHILITGDAGYGKTTLAKKLSYDWATLDATSYISHFDMLVNIPLIAMGHQTLEQSIRNALDINEEINKIIIEMKLRWLIILDGLDEALDPNLVLSFLEDNVRGYYPNSTVIITSRPHAVKDEKRLFDRRLCILGLSEENQRKYIKAVFSPNTDKEMAMVKEIENYAFLQSASECPLLLHMVCCVYGIEYDKGTSSITSRTTLYLQILNLLRIRYIKKYGNTGIVEASDVVEDDLFIKLGKVAHRYLLSSSLITGEVLRKEFSKEEDCNVVLKLGILLGQSIRFNMRVILNYEFFHRTFAEFFEAIYIVYLTKLSSPDLSEVLSASGNLVTAAFVAGLMGRKFVKHKPILQWIGGKTGTLSDLVEIKNEANLDYDSWELLSSLVERIELEDSSIERNLLRSGYTLNNFRVIEIKPRTVNGDFWKWVNQIIQESNFRAKVSMELRVYMAEIRLFEYNVKILFLRMENIMNELIHISNVLFERKKRLYVQVNIFAGSGIRITGRKKPDGLLAKCPVSDCFLNGAGGTWTFGNIKIHYFEEYRFLELKESEQESANVIPILVITETQYSTIRRDSPLDQDRLKVVDFNDVSMCRTFDDLRTMLSERKVQGTDVFERVNGIGIDSDIHDSSYRPQLVTLLNDITLTDIGKTAV